MRYRSVRLKRLLQTIGLNTQRGTTARGNYLRDKKILGGIGKHVGYQPRVIPLYPELIKMHNNIMIASNVSFVTHDAINYVLGELDHKHYPEMIGCIEIEDNVFVGANSTILYGVHIGKNVIVGANSLVNHDLEANSVYAGIPAKKIGDFWEFKKRYECIDYLHVKNNQEITEAEISHAWDVFYKNHEFQTKYGRKE